MIIWLLGCRMCKNAWCIQTVIMSRAEMKEQFVNHDWLSQDDASKERG